MGDDVTPAIGRRRQAAPALAENLPAIQHAIELMARQSPDGIRLAPPAWGDWLAPGVMTM